MGRGAWQITVHWFVKSQTWLITTTHHSFILHSYQRARMLNQNRFVVPILSNPTQHFPNNFYQLPLLPACDESSGTSHVLVILVNTWHWLLLNFRPFYRTGMHSKLHERNENTVFCSSVTIRTTCAQEWQWNGLLPGKGGLAKRGHFLGNSPWRIEWFANTVSLVVYKWPNVKMPLRDIIAHRRLTGKLSGTYFFGKCIILYTVHSSCNKYRII